MIMVVVFMLVVN